MLAVVIMFRTFSENGLITNLVAKLTENGIGTHIDGLNTLGRRRGSHCRTLRR